MKYTIETSTKFKKDYKLIKKRGYDTKLLKDVIDILADGQQLPEKISRKTLFTLQLKMQTATKSLQMSL